MLDFVVEQIDEHGEEQQVEDREQDQRRQDGFRLDDRGQARRRAHQTIDNPRLPTHLGGEPTALVGELRAEHGQHQQPEHPAPFEERSVPEVEEAQRGHRNHAEADGDHRVVKLEGEVHRGTILGLEFAQAEHRFARIAMRQPAQHARGWPPRP